MQKRSFFFFFLNRPEFVPSRFIFSSLIFSHLDILSPVSASFPDGLSLLHHSSCLGFQTTNKTWSRPYVRALWPGGKNWFQFHRQRNCVLFSYMKSKEAFPSLGLWLSHRTCPSLPSFPVLLSRVFHRSGGPAACLYSRSFLPLHPCFYISLITAQSSWVHLWVIPPASPCVFTK